MRCAERGTLPHFDKTKGDRLDAPAFPHTCPRAAERAWTEFAQEFFLKVPEGTLTAAGERLYLLPQGLPALAGKVLRAGLELGSFDGKRFTPAHALAMAAKEGDVRLCIALSDADCVRWLRGETLPCEGKGWGIVTWRSYPMGLCKAAGGTLKNHYPKGLRDSQAAL